jgi:hypothetical protein
LRRFPRRRALASFKSRARNKLRLREVRDESPVGFKYRAIL